MYHHILSRKMVLRAVLTLSLLLCVRLSINGCGKHRDEEEVLSCPWDSERCCISEASLSFVTKQRSRQLYSSRLSQLKRGCDLWRAYMQQSITRYNITMVTYVDEEHQLLYCGIPKTGSTTWSYHLVRLAGLEANGSNVYALRANESEALRTAAKEKLVCRLEAPKEVWRPMAHVLTTVFVRHPFERLVSSFENRVQTHFAGQMRDTVEKIIGRRPTPSPWPGRRFSNVTFTELVDFMLSTPAHQLNRHLAPQYVSCPFCSMDWDVIGHMETFNHDVAHVISQLRLKDVLKVETRKNTVNGTSMEERVSSAFKELNVSAIFGLYKLYEVDFDLFGYNDLSKYFRYANYHAEE